MKELGTKMNGEEVTSKSLRIVEEQWLDKFCYKKVKLEKYIEKRNRKKHDIMFQRDQKDFFQTLEAVERREDEMPEDAEICLSFGEVSESKTSKCQICRGWKR